ncbi:MAG: PIG-L deacetylase family protein [Blastocatellia bacterium]
MQNGLAEGAIAGGVLAMGAGAWWRLRTYSRLLGYKPQHSYGPVIRPRRVRELRVRCRHDSFHGPAGELPVSAFLQMNVTATSAGKWRDPFIEIRHAGVVGHQYFERGAQGARWLNLSRWMALSPADADTEVHLCGGRLTWQEQDARLWLFSDRVEPSEQVIVVAPHPDDAEVAAFGFYGSTRATVVTITSGDDSGRLDHLNGAAMALPRALMARLRVWDSLHIPAIGGIAAEQAVNLCYPDGQLASMRTNPAHEFGSRSGADVNYAELRQMNASSLLDHTQFRCSWDSLVQDLVTIFSRRRPDIVAAPLPLIDPHPDHGLTTLAVCEALKRCGLDSVRLFLYVVHNRWTELYPFGPAGSGVGLPPDFDQMGIECDALYSHTLSPEQQMLKLFALEAMHDLRDINTPALPDWKSEVRRLKTWLGAQLRGLSNPPTSFLRRAVRPDEVFFVMGIADAERLALDHARQAAEGRQ